ncbi:MAG TPA: CooT family nickel-binding protein [Candidatus Limivivens merdigallinarum]|uniref:CooT family nickel-binding protein n=2 Tax=Lachnospiraceae TaxID=186803 RepID=A0A9D0ZWD6_9FIRM|nr:CooT family nickel-binding protein [Candidatus Limivivens merdigallinarum]HIX58242.1 CooT family nickel-binding protein [Candidatus Blautia gallistercoris]
MCLATVYKKQEEPSSILLEYVSRIDVDGTTITLTDVMGEVRKVEGTIKMVDLANSKVVINCAE